MKRIWVFGVFCILLTLIFVGHNIFMQRENALLRARSDSDNLVHFLAMDMNRNLFGLNQVFLGIHNVLEVSPEESQPHSTHIRHALDRLIAANPFVTALLVLDETGKIVHWTGDGIPPSIKDRDYFTVHKAGDFRGTFVSKPFPSRVNKGQWIFAVSNGYRDSDKGLKNVVTAIVDLEYFRSTYSELRLPPGVAITIASPQGDIYSRIPGHSKFAGKQIQPIVDHLKVVDNFLFLRELSPLDGAMRGISLMRVAGYPLVMVASYDEEIALAEWRKSSALVAVFGAAVVFVFFLLTLMSVRFQREQVYSRDQLQQLAITDPLTQLANRRHAVECANLEIKKAQRQGLPLSFVLMDLDYFKKINDTYGHEKGDLVLKKVASVLNQLCRQTDVVSRFGGEEFLLILSGTDLSGAVASSEKIRKALENDVYEDFTETARVTASFGVAQWQENEVDFRDTLRRADRALYRAKGKGRNRVQVAG